MSDHPGDILHLDCPTFCPWCYDHDRAPWAGMRPCKICGHWIEYVVPWAERYDPWHGGGG